MVPIEDRATWNPKFSFVLYAFAFLTSPFSVWKFPVILSHQGGVAVFIPYTIFMLIMGLPLVYLEISLGQFMQKAGPSVWGVVPLLKGVSVASMLIGVLKISTNLIMTSWAGYYFYLILTNHLPECATDKDLPRLPANDDKLGNITLQNITRFFKNPPIDPNPGHLDLPATTSSRDGTMGRRLLEFDSSVNEGGLNMSCLEMFSQFWRDDVLDSSSNITSPGAAVLPIFVALVVVYFICFVIVVRGILWSGKIMYVLAPFPIVGLLSLAIKANIETENLYEGLGILLTPNFEKIFDLEMWFSASKLTVLSLALGVNVWPSLSSYSRLNNSISRDSWLICLLSVFINVFVSGSVFALLGNTPKDKVFSEEDPFFLFGFMPYALHSIHNVILPLFFACFIVLTVTTTVVYIESFVSSVVDISTRLQKWRLLIMAGTLSTCFLLAIPMSTQGGIFIFQLFDRMADGCLVVCFVSFLHCVGIGYVYGGRRFYDNLEMMTGMKPHWWMKFGWLCTCPLVLTATITYSIYRYPARQLNLGNDHPYHNLAWLLLVVVAVMVLLPIPVIAVWVVCGRHGSCFNKMKSGLEPELQPLQVPIRWRLEGRWSKSRNSRPL